MLRSVVNRMCLEPLIGKVDHHKVLVRIAAHQHLAALCINNDFLDVGDEAKGRRGSESAIFG